MKRLSKILGLLLIPFLFSFCKRTHNVEVWVTNSDGSKQLEQVQSTRMRTAEQKVIADSAFVIDIDIDTKYQIMIGFGGAICDNSAYVFDNYLQRESVNSLFEELFSSKGIRLNYLRMIMGSTDNSFDWYTYDDMPDGYTDENMEHFSMKKDEDVIPYFQLAKQINSELMILGSPCSPPAWMKTSKNLFSGSVKPQYYPALTRYFVKYIGTMKRDYNLDVEAITIQNEPLYEKYVPEPRYPNMYMPAEEQRDFIKGFLGPVFKENNIDTKIVIFDHNWDLNDYPLTVLADSVALQYVSATGFHCYGGGPELMKSIHEKYPEKDIYHTECSLGGWGSQDMSGIMTWLVGEVFIGNIENYTSVVLLWYMATDEKSGPVTNGCPSCRGFVTINSQTGEITRNPEYYLTGHFSKFVNKGAVRVKSTNYREHSLRNVAFVNPDGSKVVVALNSSEKWRLLALRDKEKMFTYRIEPHSTVTFKWE